MTRYLTTSLFFLMQVASGDCDEILKDIIEVYGTNVLAALGKCIFYKLRRTSLTLLEKLKRICWSSSFCPEQELPPFLSRLCQVAV